MKSSFALFILSMALPLDVTLGGEILLNDLAVKNPDGSIKVLGTEGSYNNDPKYNKEKVFDNNTSTFFEPVPNDRNSYVGISFPIPVVITQISYTGRVRFEERMPGNLFQGANSKDFSDAVTLHVTHPSEGWSGSTQINVPINDDRPFTYFRLLNNQENPLACGNVSEIKVYGDRYLPEGEVPAVPEISIAETLNGKLNIQWAVPPSQPQYRLEGKSPGESDFSYVEYLVPRATEGSQIGTFISERTIIGSAEYRLVASTTSGSAMSEVVTVCSTPFLDGTPIGVPSTARPPCFDGDISTAQSFTGSGEEWVGLDFGFDRRVASLRFLAGPQAIAAGGRFELSGDAVFTEPILLHTLGEAVGSELGVQTVSLPEEKTGRYMRFVPAAGASSDLAELELVSPRLLPDEWSQTPMEVTVDGHVDEEGDQGILKWRYPENVSKQGAVVYSSTAPGGPWEAVSDVLPEGTVLWECPPTEPGVRYYYKVGVWAAEGNEQFLSKETPFWTQSAWLERDPVGSTQLKANITVIGGVNKDFRSDQGPHFLHDNNIETHVEIKDNKECYVGYQLDQPYQVTLVKFHPRTNWLTRANGVVVYGDSRGVSWNEGWEQLSDPVPVTSKTWYTVPIEADKKFQKIVLYRSKEFYANLAEMQIWGYPINEVTEAVLRAPQNLHLELDQTFTNLSWDPAANAEGYRVEKRIQQGNGKWIPVGTIGPGGECSIRDSNEGFFNKKLEYRVASLRGQEIAWSESHEITPFQVGGVMGLFWSGHTAFDPTSYNPEGIPFTNGIAATIDFDWGLGPIAKNMSDYVMNRWTGKLIVPTEGMYTFTLRSDDGSALWIDGKSLINDWKRGQFDRETRISLTQGEHEIRVDHWDGQNEAYCTLLWEGPGISQSVIPQSQLIPIEPVPLPEPWLGERSFNQPYVGNTQINPEGDVVLTGGGCDFAAPNEGHHFLWRELTGDFDFSVKHDFQSGSGGKFMLLAKSGLEKNSSFVAASVYDDPRSDKWNYQLQYRKAKGWTMTSRGSFSGTNVGWLRLVRRGNSFRGFAKPENGAWQELYDAFTAGDGVFPETLQVGPAVTSYYINRLATFKVSEISLADPDTEALLPPQNLIFTAVDGTLTLRWEPVEGAEGYQIQSKKSDGSWVTVVENQPGTTYLQPGSIPDGHLGVYRVSSLRPGSIPVYSTDVHFSYEPGNGSGLHGVYVHPYNVSGYHPNETVVEERVDATVSFRNDVWGEKDVLPGIRDNVGVTWSGKLIVPYTDLWTFKFEADDSVALWIDGRPILNKGWTSYLAKEQLVASARLTAGIHTIRIDYNEQTGRAHCVFYWESLLTGSSGVPTSQMIPEPIILPEPWQGERTFNQAKKGGAFFSEDGSQVELWCGAGDFAATDDGRHQLWTNWKGNFDFSFKYRWHDSAETNSWTKCLLMVRTSLEDDAPAWASLVQCRSGSTPSMLCSIRTEQGGNVVDMPGEKSGEAEGWLRVKRVNNTLYFYGKKASESHWDQLTEPYTGTLPETLFVGPAMSSGSEMLQHYTISELHLGKPMIATQLLLK